MFAICFFFAATAEITSPIGYKRTSSGEPESAFTFARTATLIPKALIYKKEEYGRDKKATRDKNPD